MSRARELGRGLVAVLLAPVSVLAGCIEWEPEDATAKPASKASPEAAALPPGEPPGPGPDPPASPPNSPPQAPPWPAPEPPENTSREELYRTKLHYNVFPDERRNFTVKNDTLRLEMRVYLNVTEDGPDALASTDVRPAGVRFSAHCPVGTQGCGDGQPPPGQFVRFAPCLHATNRAGAAIEGPKNLTIHAPAAGPWFVDLGGYGANLHALVIVDAVYEDEP